MHQVAVGFQPIDNFAIAVFDEAPAPVTDLLGVATFGIDGTDVGRNAVVLSDTRIVFTETRGAVDNTGTRFDRDEGVIDDDEGTLVCEVRKIRQEWFVPSPDKVAALAALDDLGRVVLVIFRNSVRRQDEVRTIVCDGYVLDVGPDDQS